MSVTARPLNGAWRHAAPGLEVPGFLAGLERREGLGGDCAGVFLVTPERAAEWLAENNDHNRPFLPSWAADLCAAIKRGEWRLNGESYPGGRRLSHARGDAGTRGPRHARGGESLLSRAGGNVRPSPRAFTRGGNAPRDGGGPRASVAGRRLTGLAHMAPGGPPSFYPERSR